jgi:hypothetical protein
VDRVGITANGRRGGILLPSCVVGRLQGIGHELLLFRTTTGNLSLRERYTFRASLPRPGRVVAAYSRIFEFLQNLSTHWDFTSFLVKILNESCEAPSIRFSPWRKVRDIVLLQLSSLQDKKCSCGADTLRQGIFHYMDGTCLVSHFAFVPQARYDTLDIFDSLTQGAQAPCLVAQI